MPLIFEIAEPTVAQFCTQVEYMKCWFLNDRLPNGNGHGHVTHLKKIAAIISLVLVRLGTLNVIC